MSELDPSTHEERLSREEITSAIWQAAIWGIVEENTDGGANKVAHEKRREILKKIGMIKEENDSV